MDQVPVLKPVELEGSERLQFHRVTTRSVLAESRRRTRRKF